VSYAAFINLLLRHPVEMARFSQRMFARASRARQRNGGGGGGGGGDDGAAPFASLSSEHGGGVGAAFVNAMSHVRTIAIVPVGACVSASAFTLRLAAAVGGATALLTFICVFMLWFLHALSHVRTIAIIRVGACVSASAFTLRLAAAVVARVLFCCSLRFVFFALCARKSHEQYATSHTPPITIIIIISRSSCKFTHSINNNHNDDSQSTRNFTHSVVYDAPGGGGDGGANGGC
jgi:hypothetical protein